MKAPSHNKEKDQKIITKKPTTKPKTTKQQPKKVQPVKNKKNVQQEKKNSKRKREYDDDDKHFQSRKKRKTKDGYVSIHLRENGDTENFIELTNYLKCVIKGWEVLNDDSDVICDVVTNKK